MQSIPVAQFKSDFSHILQQVQQEGESFIIEYGKSHKKVAMIVPYVEEKKERTFGQLQGTYVVPDDFDNESDEINRLFYGDAV
jgi:antitoxin (DNA-binding transcriptional repressor) of toxin-antitoxin stability system